MPKVVFNPTAQTIEVIPGTSLLDAARQAGIELDTPCGGEGSCGKCIVRIESGNYDTDNLGILPDSAVKEGYALACKTYFIDSDIVVEVPELTAHTGGQFVEDEEADWLFDNNLLPQQTQIDPLAQKYCCTVPKPQLEDGLSDLDRLKRCLQKDGEKKEIDCSLSVLRSLPDTLRIDDGKVTVTLTNTPATYYIVDIESGDHTARHYGIVVDVGTTTVAVQLVSLFNGAVIATRTDYNAQISCGLDVISRIHYARNQIRREELRVRVLSTINNLIRKITQNHGVDINKIRAAVIAGNTTMVHLLLGLNPEYIRLEPYTPTLHQSPLFTAEEIGIHIHSRSRILICPSVGSYVGGDITAGLLCTNLSTEDDSIQLFMDIGTNGELVIGNRDFLMTCACSAGPAFEGGGIEQGMRAATGAIERVEIDPGTAVAKYWTIGNVKPIGICGSGMISLLANLYLTGWIDQAGKLNRSWKSPVIQIDGKRTSYVIVPADQSGVDKAITISELDIENLIRAKAAIYSAIRLLLQHVDIEMEKIHNIYIAGGFGRFLDLDQAITIGLIPDLPREKYRYIGNSSLMGAYLALISGEYRNRLFEVAHRMTYIELNTNPDYMHQYTGAMFLPHTDLNLFPSIQQNIAKKQ
jgi:uncharacterized 2Fe-2S/4Fe-4S cluster protein (DUF4445 family)